MGCSSRFSVKILVKILLLKVRARVKFSDGSEVIGHDELVT
jgi:hypothetical protein